MAFVTAWEYNHHMEEQVCARDGCNNTFPPGTGKTWDKKFCSDDCRYRGYRQRLRAKIRKELEAMVDEMVKAKVRL